MATLNAEQKRIIRLIEQEAIKVGVDPDFAVALASLESTFRHVPADDKKSTAFGPFQVNKATAQANGVDYDEMKNSPELAVRAGVLNIARHAQNPQLGGDPMRIAAAHRLGESSEYAKTGDISKIDTQLAGYLASAMEHFPNEEFPSAVYTPTKTESASTATEGSGSESLDMGSVPLSAGSVGEQAQAETDQEAFDRKLAAAEVGSAGALFGAVKVPTLKILHRLSQALPGSKVSVEDAAKIAEKMITGQMPAPQAGAPSPAVEPKSTPSSVAANVARHGGENWVKSLTGVDVPGGQMSKADLDVAKGMQSAVGRTGEPGFVGGKITPGGIIITPQTAASIDTKTQEAQTVADKARRVREAQRLLAQRSTDQSKIAESEFLKRLSEQPKVPVSQPDIIARSAQNVLGSSPLRYGLAGAGIGYNLEDAYQNFSKPDALNKAAGVASTGGALASALGLVPKYAARANPAAIGLTTAAQVMGDVQRGDKQAASESGLAGLTALFPRLFGPIGAAVYSGGLNKGDAEELERRRKMPPTITRP